ncbi:hypothetical protein OHR68_03245 [Spirillospora sp. NBC_00431]
MAYTADKATQLISRATRRRTDGSRNRRAQRSWRRLVRACAEGDAAVQDAIRETTGDLPEADVLDLLAAAPEQPADQAAYLALIGQDAQRQALDPDGSFLALAYRAATPETRERLRTAMAATGEADVIRVVVTGDQRDRATEMTHEELDYLGHHLAEHHQWDELRRLTRDLPLAKAVAAARLLPAQERTTPLAPVPEQLRRTIERLPRDRRITHQIAPGTGEVGLVAASFSPDLSELALSYGTTSRDIVKSLDIATGEAVRHFSKGNRGEEKNFPHSVLHLGDEILDLHRWKSGYRVLRVMPDIVPICEGSGFVGGGFGALRRSSRGAVTMGRAGLKFIDPGADEPRFQLVPQFSGKTTEPWLYQRGLLELVATLPSSRLIAFFFDDLFVLNEDGRVLHKISKSHIKDHSYTALSFLSPRRLAVNGLTANPGKECTEIWDVPPDGPWRLTERRMGALRKRWPREKWRGLPLEPAFAARVITSHVPSGFQDVLTVAPGADMTVTATAGGAAVEVESPHLPAARALLERPLLRSSPKDLQHARRLRTKITHPGVRDALDLLSSHLADRFGGDIALGTGPMSAGGPTDIALDTGRPE